MALFEFVTTTKTTPEISLAIVNAFYAKAQGVETGSDVYAWIEEVKKVDGVVKGMTQQGLVDPAYRQALVDQTFFENMIARGSAGNVPQIMGDIWKLGELTPEDLPSPHAVMLEELKDLGGGFWAGEPAPNGLTPWVLDPYFGGVAVANMLKVETDGNALANMIALLRDIAVPAVWAQILLEQHAYETVNERLPRERWHVDATADLKTRQALQGLTAQAQARAQAAVAVAALPSFPAGNGVKTPTLPPMPRPWWKRGPTVAGSVLGFLGGAMYATSRKRRAS